MTPDITHAGAQTVESERRTTGPIVDTDVHEMLGSARELLTYLPREWARYIDSGWSYPFFFSYGYPTDAGFARTDAIPKSGPAGSDLELMRDQLLDAFDIETAILTSLFFPGDMRVQREFGNAIARAYNDWVFEKWLSVEPRLRGSICVNVSDPRAAAAEIDRVAARPGYVQVILGPSDRGYGDQEFNPIFDAAVRNGLAVGIHPSARAQTAIGYPEYLAEWRVLGPPQQCQCQLVSLVFHGVLERYPDLRVVFIEGGWTWVPHLLRRMDENYRSLRPEVPWLRRLPSEYVGSQIRFTSQPSEALAVGEFEHVLEQVGGAQMLFFSSDYPHWDFDSPVRGLPAGLPREVVRQIMYENAKAWYRL
jgi:predicted TIM-barrel fold metal-dependent hydrolase